MKTFIGFLGEAFPPPAKKPAVATGGLKTKAPFGNSAGPKTSPFSKKNAPPPKDSGASDDQPFPKKGPGDDDEEVGPGTEDNNDALMQMQQAQQEKEKQEQELAQQKAAEDRVEREKIKHLRTQADDEVASALLSKYNPEEDEVEFYPDMLSFAQYNMKKEKGVKNGKGEIGPDDATEEDHGSTPKIPTDEPVKDENDDEDDEDKVHGDPRDQDPVRSSRKTRGGESRVGHEEEEPEDGTLDKYAEKEDRKSGNGPKTVRIKRSRGV